MRALLYLLLCLVRDGRLSMIGLVSEHSVDISTTIPYGGYSDVTHFLLKQTWVEILPIFLVFPSIVFLAVMHLPHNQLRLSSTDFFFRWSLILDPELIIPKKIHHASSYILTLNLIRILSYKSIIHILICRRKTYNH